MTSQPKPAMTAELWDSIAAEHGTPSYVYQPAVLNEDLARFAAASRSFSGPTQLAYSLKTNYLPSLLSDILAAGLGVDVVSPYEFTMAQRAGFSGEDIIVNGPHKPRALLASAVQAGAYINLETLEEVAELSALAEAESRQVAVGVRLGSPIDPYTGGPRTLPSKFGAPVSACYATQLLDAIGDCPRLELTGIHCHLGSQLVEPSHYFTALSPVLELAGYLRHRFPLDRVNVGGGFGVGGISRSRRVSHDPSRPDMAANDFDFVEPDLPTWFSEFSRQWRRCGLDGLRLVLEPGRAIASRCMELLTRVVSVKVLGEVRQLTVDGGVNLMPTAGPGEAHAFRFPGCTGYERPARIVGPLCYEGDIFSLSSGVPQDVAVGQLVLVADAGAYTVSRATSFNQLRAPVVRLDSDGTRLVWRRETADDILAFAVSDG